MPKRPNPANFKASTVVAAAATWTRPAWAVQGDLLVVHSVAASSISTPSGWTLVAGGSGGSYYHQLFCKLMGDEAGTTTYTFTGATGLSGIVVYGCSGTVGAAQFTYQPSTSSPANAGITTSYGNSLLIGACIEETGVVTYTAPSGWTERLDSSGSNFISRQWEEKGTSTGSVAFTPSSGPYNFGTFVAEFPFAQASRRRFYFDGSTVAPLTTATAWGTQWTGTAAWANRRLNNVKGSSATTSATRSVSTASATQYNFGLAQFVSEPVQGNQTLSGSFKIQCRGGESNTGANAVPQVVVRVINSTGGERSVAYGGDTRTGASTAGEFGTSLANRCFPNHTITRALTSVGLSEGDCIVVELGARRMSHSVASTRTITINFGEPGTDLSENTTETAANAPWIEFDTFFALVSERRNQGSVV